jgi:hypothetical protein
MCVEESTRSEKQVSETPVDNSLFRHAKFGPRITKAVTAYALCSTAYKSGKQWYERLKTQQQYQITVNGTDAIYDDLHEWILSQLPEDRRKSLIARTGEFESDKVPQSSDADSAELEVSLVRLNYDSSSAQKVSIYGHPVVVQLDEQVAPTILTEISSGHSFRRSFVSLRLKAQSPEGRDAVIRLIDDLARKQREKKHVATIRIGTRWGSWEVAKSLRPRKWESLVLKDGTADKVRDDLQTFLDSEEEYNRRSIPWHRGYLFHGPAGTGKSSLVLALATHFDMDLWALSLGDLKTDTDLISLVSGVRGGILLLEDIDVFGAAKERTAENEHVSLSALLNSLDGATTPHGLITMMTTNHLGSIDKALYRPGRIDLMVELEEARWPQVIAMLENWYQVDSGDGKYVNQGDVFNPAQIQEIMRNNDFIYKAMDEIRKVGKDVTETASE